jgi:hypothetical protein
MAITDLEVTFGAALGTKDFHRVVTKSGHGADINKGVCACGVDVGVYGVVG